MLEGYSADLVADKGGADSITAGERRMVEIGQTARGASMLILAEAARSGFIVSTEGGWDLAPGAKELGKFLNTERAAITTLGLKRREKQIESINDILAEIAGKDSHQEQREESGD